ncbi:MAG: oligosaccharide flippase family protein [Bacteroidetes bacterium]|nr:oligosaccharide flippase family protein [Bacteroidota bacterium]
MFIQRLIYVFSSLVFIGYNYIKYNEITFITIVLSQLAGYGLAGGFALWRNNIRMSVKYVDVRLSTQLIAYGKYNVGTMISSSLLRNADTFMIAGFLGSGAVAVYTLAQKFIEIFEVILRSVAVTSLPLLISVSGNVVRFAQVLLTRVVLVTVIFVPVVLLLFSFSAPAIQLISASSAYNDSALILQILLVYVLLLPADRFLGIALEAVSLPHFNLIKTLLLISVNVAGNLIVLSYFSSLMGTALVSILALITGIISGYYFLKKYYGFKFSGSSFTELLLKFKLQ